jgi:tRNA(Ile)-lysidine synthase
MHALGARVRAIHIDHGLQLPSAQWARHCLDVCAALGVACTHERIDVVCEDEESVEAAARRLRYRRLAERLTDGEILLTAHHGDDQAETLLLALLRGAGVHGLAAMPVLTAFPPGRHARPLLTFPRTALTDYARVHNLRWIEDASNANENMSRNFLRHSVLPLLTARWPTAAARLGRAALNSADSAALHDEIADADLATCRTAGPATLSMTPLRALSPARQRNALRHWIVGNGFHAPSARHLELIRAQLDTFPQSAHACIDWPEAEVRRYRDTLTVRARAAPLDVAMKLPWVPPQELSLPGAGLRVQVQAVKGYGLSQEKLRAHALTVRWRQGGETCQLAGHRHHVELRKLLQQSGVPPWERERLPLIYADEALAAIGDRWVCAPFAAAPDEPGWQIHVAHALSP